MNLTTPTPEGFKLAYEVMTRAEEEALIELIQASGLSKLHFSDEPDNYRSSMSYVHKYDLPSQRFVPAAPMPDGFHLIAGRAADFAGLAFEEIVHCALNGYEPGAMVQPHIDMPCWDRVVGISLGAPAIMTLSRVVAEGEEQTVAIELPPRSMYLLRGEARHDWEHGVPPVERQRWSITFRNFSARGMLENCNRAASRRYP